MKKLFLLLSFVSCNALAVDVTITMTAGQISRYATALGKLRGYVDGSGNPRVATTAEMKQFVIDSVRGVVFQSERPPLEKAAVDAVVVPAFDPT